MARESIGQEVSDLRRELTDLNMLINKMVATNINVQSKVTESLIKMDDLLKEVKDMVELLQVATEMESGPSEVHGLNDLVDANKMISKSMVSIEDYMKKIYRRLIIISQSATVKNSSSRLSQRPSMLSSSSLPKLPMNDELSKKA